MKFAVSLNARTTGRGTRDFLLHNYVPYLSRLGMVPVLIPNTIDDLPAYLAALDVCGIVLTGGGDVNPARYGQPNTHAIEIVDERDRTEFRLLDWAFAGEHPVLGICRGIQTINVYLGGELVQDIPTQLNGTVDHDDADHPVQIVDDSIATLLSVTTMVTNSYHHQAITADLLVPDLVSFAISAPDGVIEGVRHASFPLLGVQWHPERPTPSHDLDVALFRHFLAHGAFWTA